MVHVACIYSSDVVCGKNRQRNRFIGEKERTRSRHTWKNF